MDPAKELDELTFLAPDADTATLRTLLSEASGHHALVVEAIEVADAAHLHQRRDEGAPYVVHPLRVAHSLASIGEDAHVVAAALLHDVFEDSPQHSASVRRLGPDVVVLVEALTDYWDEDYYGKIVVAGQGASRIKMADRVDNLRFLHRTVRYKQVRYVRETSRAFPPIAETAGSLLLSRAMQALLSWHVDRLERETP